MRGMLPITVRRWNQLRLAVATAWCTFGLVGLVASAGAQPPAAPTPRRAPLVDHAVQPAGGLACRHCGGPGCQLHRGHLGECRDGLCAPHCPVRPSQHGFYRTQWRRWPGQGVVPASAEDAATPVTPPSSQVPTADEESPRPAEGDPAPITAESDAAPADRPRAAEDLPVEPFPEAEAPTKPAAPAPETSPVPPTPPGEPPVPPQEAPKDGDLFDQSALPIPEEEAPVNAGAMRYPAAVGRSIAAGGDRWRLDTRGGQRDGESARGL